MSKKPWFSKGLKFDCRRCSGCCRGEPGYVWIGKDEIAQMADYLLLPVEEFSTNYVRQVGYRYSLKELPGGDCILWGGVDKGCLVYPVRPVQCQTFPFWSINIETETDWERASKRCPGVNNGKTYSLDEILKRVKQTDKKKQL